MMTKVIVICGPTASGKSQLALNLALALKGEIISADSMQIYRDMDVATAKVSEDEQAMIPHHMIDIISPLEHYSVASYVEEARTCLNKISQRSPVIICGGTGQYINALVDNIQFFGAEIDHLTREQITKEITEDNCAIYHRQMSKLDPEHAAKIATTDLKRLRRFFELYRTEGITISEANRRSRQQQSNYEFLCYCLMPDRDVLYDRINRRTSLMFAEGIIEETARLLKLYPGVAETQAFQAIGYNFCYQYLHGQLSKLEAEKLTAQKTRNYAKRQYTWFKRRQDFTFIEQDRDNFARIIKDFKRD